jgi:hypothetical protein
MAASDPNGGSELQLGLERNARNRPTGRIYCECCDQRASRPEEIPHDAGCPLADE